MLKLMFIVFTYDDNYVGKQTSGNCEDAVQICILFWTKRTPGQKRPALCRCVCIFIQADEG